MYGSLCVSNMLQSDNNGKPEHSPSRAQNLQSGLDDPSRSDQAVIIHSMGLRQISPRIWLHHVVLEGVPHCQQWQMDIGRSCI